MPFVRGKPRPVNSGRRAGTPNRRTIQPKTYPDALEHLASVMTSKSPLVTAELKTRAAIGLAAYQHCKPAGPKAATFAPKPFGFRKPTTMAEANAETTRVAEAVAAGELDHDTGQFLLAAIRLVVETLAGVKLEEQIAAADAAGGVAQ
jgi:hypothetical protein